MEMRRLGRTGLHIAPLVLGGNVFGWTVDEKTSFEVLDRFAQAGFNAIDTSDNYSRWAPGNVGGESEVIIGKWMKSRGNRADIAVITKVGSDVGQGKRDISAPHIKRAIEASLKRLQTDYVDLYLSHWHVPGIPYEETLGAYQQLLESGKVRFIGASNHDATQLREALDCARTKSLPRYEVLEPEYNLYNRPAFEGPLRDLCLREGIGVIVYYALAQGFFTGKYRSEADLGQSTRGGGVRAYLNERGLRILAALDEVAEHHGAKVAEIALAWTIAQPGITAPIASATEVEQIETLVRSATITLSPSELALLDRVSSQGRARS